MRWKNPARMSSFPDSSVDMNERAIWANPPVLAPKTLQRKVLKDERPSPTAPASIWPRSNLEEVRAQLIADLDGFKY